MTDRSRPIDEGFGDEHSYAVEIYPWATADEALEAAQTAMDYADLHPEEHVYLTSGVFGDGPITRVKVYPNSVERDPYSPDALLSVLGDFIMRGASM